MKKTIPALAATVALSFGSVAVAPDEATAAQSKKCATKNDFRKVKNGQTKAKVKKILKTGGTLQYKSGAYMNREYRACGKYSYISVSYEKGLVDHKTGAWY